MFDVYKWSQYVIMDVMRKLCFRIDSNKTYDLLIIR